MATRISSAEIARAKEWHSELYPALVNGALFHGLRPSGFGQG